MGAGITSVRLITRPEVDGTFLAGTSGIITDTTVSFGNMDYAGDFQYAKDLTGTIGGNTQSYAGSQDSANAMWLQVVSSGANLNQLTAGESTLWIGTIPTF